MNDFFEWVMDEDWRVFLAGVLAFALALSAIALTIALFWHGLWAVNVALWVVFPAWLLISGYRRDKGNKP
jgi:hypothetical protein